MLKKISNVLALVTLTTLPVLAQPAEPARPGKAEPAAEKTIVEEKLSVTRHTATVGGERIDYTATAGTLVLETEE
ncbi:MAG TPA: peptidase S10, partial [Thermoanaerobaculia bacterium]|nr:peptidase S10 [Thermoanaerobaculia bacterium]